MTAEDTVPQGIWPDYIRDAFIMCRPYHRCFLVKATIDEQAFAWDWMEWLCEYESLARLPQAIETTHVHSKAKEYQIVDDDCGERKEIRIFIRPDGYYRTEHTDWYK